MSLRKGKLLSFTSATPVIALPDTVKLPTSVSVAAPLASDTGNTEGVRARDRDRALQIEGAAAAATGASKRVINPWLLEDRTKSKPMFPTEVFRVVVPWRSAVTL